MSRKNPINYSCCGFQEEKYEDKERLEGWRRKELKRQSNTRPYSPIARPRRIKARMIGRCRGPRPQFAPGEEVFARARIFRPGRNYSSELHEFLPGRNYSSKLHEFSLQARNCGSGEKPLELSQECVHRVKEGKKRGSETGGSKEKSIEVTKPERELTVSQAIFRCWVVMAAMGS